jgi:hypothetical protein
MKKNDNLVGQGFHTNPERINKKGANRKLYSTHIKDIKDKGYEAPTKVEYFDMMGLILAMTETDLKEFAKDTEKPYWIRLIVIDLNSKATRQRMMSDYRDWLFGKAEQKTDITSKGEQINSELSILMKSYLELHANQTEQQS